MDPIREQIDVMTRRHFFGRAGVGLGTAALASLLADGVGPGVAAEVDRSQPAGWVSAGVGLRAGCRACPTSRPRRSGPSTCS